MSILIEQFKSQDWIEWIGLITGIVYVVLAAYEKPSCWIFGIISCGAIAWKSFTDYQLVADGVLQLFYIVIGFIGLQQWMAGQQEDKGKPVITSPLRRHVIAIAICLLLSIPVSWLLIHFAFARYGYIDTALTFLSVYATILLVRKDLHNWWYWIIIDLVYIGLYYASEGYLFAMLFLVYAGVAVWGYKKWQNVGTM